MNLKPIDTVIFDLGGVLIDWDPRYLYRKILKEDQIDWFLNNICTAEWNDQQDAGRSFEEATRELVETYPEWEEAITAWYGRWKETIRGPVMESVDLLGKIKEKKTFRLYALTNWSAETFPWALENFEFLHWFEGIVVSGKENTRKPFPEIYHTLFSRFNVDPSSSLFIDDNIRNIETGERLGLQTIHFQNPSQLKAALIEKKILG
ncbi:MAG TPA: HAD family phosphatase [Chryseosolibacter sp.]|nr:HAD family phosphatase [Chryseosolibacter sp.]